MIRFESGAGIFGLSSCGANLLTSSVLCFIAQRLVRVVCAECQEERPTDPSLAAQFGITKLPKVTWWGKGCGTCKGTGYKGRTAIYEFLVLTDAVQELILRRASSQEIAEAALRGGMQTLRQSGWQKILQGVTTPAEVLRVT